MLYFMHATCLSPAPLLGSEPVRYGGQHTGAANIRCNIGKVWCNSLFNSQCNATIWVMSQFM